MTRVVIAEKPSVARDLARALGAKEKAEGYLHGNGYTVTWAIGHLVALAEPHEINPAWKRWRAEDLPILPERWPLKVLAKTRKQFTIVKRLLTAKATTEVICATDAGREGELIFRYVQEQAGCRKPVRRLWISSLTPEAIRDGFARLRDGAAFDALADAARGRSRADWLVGMNLSRVYTLQSGEAVSVGRVQTPTLSLLVDREQEIAAFVPEDYLEVVASFRPTGAEGVYVGTYFDPERVPKKRADGEVDTSTRLPAEGPRAAEIAARALRGAAVITSIDRATRRIPPPLLYDLTELQRHANRLYGYSAKQTLDAAQKLYERHKLISYPRTDSRHLSRDVAATLPELVEGPAAAERAIDPARVAPGTGERPLGPRFVDDARVTDHHAILPTRKRPTKLDPDSIEGRLYELICRRLLAAWHDDHVYATTTVINEIKSDGPEGPIVDHYRSRGREVCQVGWKILDPTPLRARKRGRAKDEDDDDSGEPALPVGLAKGQPQDVIDARSVAKRTRPPPRFTESTLLTAMETAGKTLEDRELADAMRERGLG
ncbi:MAG: RecQ family ATP-dependent DNA helicase, partial [Myxococcales bacterium]|nr:RecQ family ATP-dependent DNA helicase [Myxococcales bacterium]